MCSASAGEYIEICNIQFGLHSLACVGWRTYSCCERHFEYNNICPHLLNPSFRALEASKYLIWREENIGRQVDVIAKGRTCTGTLPMLILEANGKDFSPLHCTCREIWAVLSSLSIHSTISMYIQQNLLEANVSARSDLVEGKWDFIWRGGSTWALERDNGLMPTLYKVLSCLLSISFQLRPRTYEEYIPRRTNHLAQSLVASWLG